MHRINRRSPTFHPVNLPWVRQWKLCESVMVSVLLAQNSQDWMDEHTFEVLTGVFLIPLQVPPSYPLFDWSNPRRVSHITLTDGIDEQSATGRRL